MGVSHPPRDDHAIAAGAPPEVQSGAPPASRVRYLVLAAGCSLAFLAYVHRQSLVRGAPDMQEALGLNKGQMGLAQGAFLLGYGLFQIPWGLLGDRVGARQVLLIVVLGWSLLTGLTALAEFVPAHRQWPFVFLLAARFLFGGFQAGFFPVWARVVADWIPLSERGTAQGTVWTFSRIGGALGPFFFYWLLLLSATWTMPLWYLAGAGAIWAVLFWMWFRNRPEEMPKVNDAEMQLIVHGRTLHASGPARLSWPAVATSRNFWALCLMYGFVGFAGNFITNLLPVYLRDVRRLSPEVTTWITGSPLAVGIVSCALGGILSDWIVRNWGSRKWGRRFNGACGLGLAGLALVAVPWAEPVWLLAAILCASFFFNDLNMGPAWAAAADVGGPFTGTISGSMNMTGNLAGAVGMAFAGQMLEKGYGEALFLIFGCSYALAALCWLLVDVTKPVNFDQNPHVAEP